MLREEAAWLKAEVYGGRAPELEAEKIDAQTCFRARSGPRIVRVL